MDSGHILEDEVGICTSCADAAAHFDAALQHAQAKWQTLYENTQELLACFTSCAAAGEGAPAATCYDFTGGPCASLYQVWEVNSTAASTAYGLALDWYYAMSIGGCPNLPPPPLPFAFPGLPSIPGVPPPQLSPFPVPPAPLPTPG